MTSASITWTIGIIFNTRFLAIYISTFFASNFANRFATRSENKENMCRFYFIIDRVRDNQSLSSVFSASGMSWKIQKATLIKSKSRIRTDNGKPIRDNLVDIACNLLRTNSACLAICGTISMAYTLGHWNSRTNKFNY